MTVCGPASLPVVRRLYIYIYTASKKLTARGVIAKRVSVERTELHLSVNKADDKKPN